jgi:sec-independent protein translocase protein TatA
MIGQLGPSELIMVLGLALLVLGPRKPTEIARSIGAATGEFRKVSSQLATHFGSTDRLQPRDST